MSTRAHHTLQMWVEHLPHPRVPPLGLHSGIKEINKQSRLCLFLWPPKIALKVKLLSSDSNTLAGSSWVSISSATAELLDNQTVGSLFPQRTARPPSGWYAFSTGAVNHLRIEVAALCCGSGRWSSPLTVLLSSRLGGDSLSQALLKQQECLLPESRSRLCGILLLA